MGEKLTAESNLMTEEIRQRLHQLSSNWDELRVMAKTRGQKLDESLVYQQFAANVEEEEAWITEKQHLMSGDDYGDTLAAVQVPALTPAFETMIVIAVIGNSNDMHSYDGHSNDKHSNDRHSNDRHRDQGQDRGSVSG